MPAASTCSVVFSRRCAGSSGRTRRLRSASRRHPVSRGRWTGAYCGAFPDAEGQPIKIYAFVMVLGFSRILFVQFTTSMDLPQLLACHLEAFTFFGGWPRELLYDNMAQVKQPGSADWNPLFLDFAHHHGFVPKTCRVRRPRTKGKVERAIGYVKQNFLAGRFVPAKRGALK